MVNCIAIGDTHFKINNLSESEKFIKEIIRIIKDYKPDIVILLGDILDKHEQINVFPYNIALNFIKDISFLTKVYVIIGNHDYCNNQQFLSNNHPFNSLKNHKNITICDKVLTEKIKSHNKEVQLTFLPFVPPGRFKEALNTSREYDWKNSNCIFAHQEFYGCSYNPIKKSEIGDKYEENLPLVISGHIHNKQWLQKNIYYTGSSMQHSYTENTNKSIILIDFDKLQDNNMPLEDNISIINNFPTIKEITLENIKKKKTVYININDIEQFDINKYMNFDLKLVITGESHNIKKFRKTKIYKNLEKLNILISFKINDTIIHQLEYSHQKCFYDIFNDNIHKHISKDQSSPSNKYLLDSYNLFLKLSKN